MSTGRDYAPQPVPQPGPFAGRVAKVPELRETKPSGPVMRPMHQRGDVAHKVKKITRSVADCGRCKRRVNGKHEWQPHDTVPGCVKCANCLKSAVTAWAEKEN